MRWVYAERDVILPIVPMFHVNAWGMPFAAVFFGTTQVLPGPGLNPKLLLDLIEQEKVTLTAGVPTIWLAVLKEQEQNPRDLSSLRGDCKWWFSFTKRVNPCIRRETGYTVHCRLRHDGNNAASQSIRLSHRGWLI